MKSFGLLAVALLSLCLFAGLASAQSCGHCSNAVIAAPIVSYAQPLVSFVAPVVQLQQVVQAAPIVQQQVIQQQVQAVTVPTVPQLNYLVSQPLAVVQQHHHQAAAIVVGGHANAIVSPRFIVGNRQQRLVVVNQRRQPALQLNIGRRR